MPFEEEIREYENVRRQFQTAVVDKMNAEEYAKYNEVIFSTHSCAIEGNTFSVEEYISALRMIRTEATDEHLIRFFFKMATQRMQEEMKQKTANTRRFTTFMF